MVYQRQYGYLKIVSHGLAGMGQYRNLNIVLRGQLHFICPEFFNCPVYPDSQVNHTECNNDSCLEVVVELEVDGPLRRGEPDPDDVLGGDDLVDLGDVPAH